MDLKDYVKKRKEELDRFAEGWSVENSNDPEEWPMSMSEEEWLEQEIAELSQNGREVAL